MDEFECTADSGRNAEPRRFRGTAADDRFLGEGESDTIFGLEGDDLLHGCDDSDRIDGGPGADRLIGGNGADTMSGGEGGDELEGGPGRDDLSGDGGNDALRGGDADDTLRGGPGSDTLLGQRGLDRLEGGPGADRLEGNEGGDELFGGGDRDTLVGGPGNDRLFGEAGDDSLVGQGGADTLDGGPGTDTVRLPGRRADTTIDGDASRATLRGPGGPDTLVDVEFVEFDDGIVDLRGEPGGRFLLGGPGPDILDGGPDDDTLTGLGGGDRLFGANGRDQLSGDDGADDLAGGNGDDALAGGAGNDTVMGQQGDDTIYGFAPGEEDGAPGEPAQGGGGTLPDPGPGVPDDDSLMGGAGRDLVFGGTGDDTIIGQADEDRLFGGPGADLVEGKKQSDELFGEDGDDRLFGGAGDDTLDGGAGDDTLYPQTGDDTVIGGPGLDRAVFPGLLADYRVVGTLAEVQVDGVIGNNLLIGVEILEFGDATIDLRDGGLGNLRLVGTPGADDLIGDTGNDTLIGGGGGDTLRGGPGTGADSLEGQGGDDRLIGGAGPDELYGEDGADSLFGHDGADELFGGDGPDRLEGNAGADYLQGDAGPDSLFGGLGDDLIRAGAGNDRIGGQEGDDEIDGGGGVDTAVFPGFAAAYTVTGDEIFARVSGPDGFDELSNVELIEFDDRVIDLRVDPPPPPSPGTSFDIDPTGAFDRPGAEDRYDSFEGVLIGRSDGTIDEILFPVPAGDDGITSAADVLPALSEALIAAGYAATVRIGDARLGPEGQPLGGGDPRDSLNVTFTEADGVELLVAVPPPLPGLPDGYATREILATGRPTADFAVRNLSVSETALVAGGSFAWSYEYANFGDLAAPIEVDVFLSSNPVVTAEETFLRRITHPAGAETGFLSFDSGDETPPASATLPEDLPPGTYYVSVIADADRLVDEAVELNNFSDSVAIEVLPPADRPDFTVGNLLISDTFFAPGDSFDFVYSVGNLEPQSGTVPTRIYLSPDPTITTDDRFLYFADHEGLPPGQATVFASALDSGFPPVLVPRDVVPGNYFIGAIADPLGTAQETNEANNVSNAVPITVSAFEPSLPDISPRNFRVSDTVVAPGDPFLFTVDVTNLGSVNTPGEVAILFSSDPFFDPFDPVAIRLPYSDLAPAEIQTEGFIEGDQVPLGLAPGIYSVAAVADPGGFVFESNEFNNISNVVLVEVTDFFGF